MSGVKAKLKPPAIAIIVSVGIGLVQCLYGLMLPDYKVMQGFGNADASIIAAVKVLWVLAFPVYAFSIYSALQMMNANKHGFAIMSAIITILSGCQNLIGFPIGIWALIVLLKPEIKSAFEGNNTPSV